MSNFQNSIKRTESGGDYRQRNDAVGSSGRRGHYGILQFGHDRLDDARNAGVLPANYSAEDFVNDEAMQDRVEAWHWNDIDSQAEKRGLNRFLGQTVGGVKVTPEAIRSMAHIGGMGGAEKFLTSGGAYNPSDINGTSIQDYGITHGGTGSPSGVPEGALSFAQSSEGGTDMNTPQASWIANPYMPEVTPKDPQTKLGKWTAEKMPWLTDNRADALLAIGTGLLSGDDWASGIAGAGTNLMGVNKDRRDKETEEQVRRQEALMRDFELNRGNQWDMEQEAVKAQRAKGDVKMYSLGNVQMPDGSTQILSQGTDGLIYDAGGNPVDPALLDGAMKINNSDAFGSKGQPGFNDATQMQSQLMMQKAGMEAIDRVQTYLASDPSQGISKVFESANAMLRTLTERGLTDEQIDRAIATGDMQALIGQTREAVVGPGVMTEPDAVRVMASLGGDFRSILQNPDAFAARLSIVGKDMYALYEHQYNQYEATRTQFPRLGYTEVPRYTGPLSQKAQEAQGAPLDQSNGQTPAPTSTGSLPPRPADVASDAQWQIIANDPELAKHFPELAQGAQNAPQATPVPGQGQPPTQQAAPAASAPSNAGPSVMMEPGALSSPDMGNSPDVTRPGADSGMLADAPMPPNYPYGPEAWAVAPDETKLKFIEAMKL